MVCLSQYDHTSTDDLFGLTDIRTPYGFSRGRRSSPTKNP